MRSPAGPSKREAPSKTDGNFETFFDRERSPLFERLQERPEVGRAGDNRVALHGGDERGGFIAGQFDNPANTAAHRTGTGKEILRDLPDVDFIYAGIGTGGTASGIGLACRDCGSKAKVVGIEPAESPLITQGRSGSHNIQGIGSNFVPGNYLPEAVDSVETVPTEDAIATAVELARKEGIFAGISSGANVFAAIRKAREEPSARIVAILPDGGEKYMSLGIYE